MLKGKHYFSKRVLRKEECCTENRYTGRNVDLMLLSEWVERFFEKKNFRTIREERIKAHKITARPTYVHEVLDRVTVYIFGDPNDFVLKFITGARSSLFVKLGRLTTLFGGGIAFLRGVKSQEAEEQLERNFWIYVNEKIDFIAGSART